MGDNTTSVSSDDQLLEQLAELEQITNPSEKVRVLVELTSQLLPSRLEVLEQALTATQSAYQSDRAKALAAIAPQLPETATVLLQQALQIAQSIDNLWEKAYAFSAIAPRLPETAADLLQQALQIAQSSNNPDYKARTLSAIASRLPESQHTLLQQALQAVQSSNDRWSKAKTISAVAPRLPETATDLLQQALQVVQSIDEPEDKANAISAIVFRLPETATDSLQQALQIAQSIDNPRYKANAISAIASRLPETATDLLQQALQIAQSIDNPEDKANAISAIVSRLPETATDLLQQVLQIAQSIDKSRYKVSILSTIAPRLPKSQQHTVFQEIFQEIQSIAQSMDHPVGKASTLNAIASRLPKSQQHIVLQLALQIAQSIDNFGDKASTLSEIAPRLFESQQHTVLQQALQCAKASTNLRNKISALSAITPRLPKRATDLLQEAFQIAQSIRDPGDKASDLSTIAPYLPAWQQHKVLQQVLQVVQSNDNPAYKANALSEIAPRLPESATDLLQQALQIAQSIDNPANRAIALSAIASRLPQYVPDLLQQALQIAQSIDNPANRAIALVVIAPYLPESMTDLFQQALQAAQSISDPAGKAECLSTIAPRLPESQQHAILRSALRTTQAIANPGREANVLSAIVSQLPESPPDLLQLALQIAQSIENLAFRVKVLSAVVFRLPESPPDLLRQAFQMAQSIHHPEKFSAISAIVSRLPESEKDLLQQAFQIAQSTPFSKASAISAIVSRLPEFRLQQVLQMAFSIDDPKEKATTLGAIALRMSKSQQPTILQQALQVAQSIENSADKSKIVTAIAPQLPESPTDLLQQALQVVEDIGDSMYKASALRAIVPRLPELPIDLLQKALQIAQYINNPEDKANALIAIASQLSKSTSDLLQQALQVAQSIYDPTYKASALGAIGSLVNLDNLKSFLEATFNLSDAAKSLSFPATRFTEEFVLLYPSNKHSTALNIVQHIQDETNKTKFLSALIPRLSVGLLPRVLRIIEETFKVDCYRAEALSNLVFYLPEDQLPEALRLIIEIIQDSHHKTSALEILIPLLPIRSFKKVLNLLETNTMLPQQQTTILNAIAIALTTQEQTTKLSEAISTATFEATQIDQVSLSFYKEILWRIFYLMRQLQKSKREGFSYERSASSILSQLASVLHFLSKEQQEEVQSEINRFEELEYQAVVLIALAPNFKEFVQASLESYIGDDYLALLSIKIQLALIDPSKPPSLEDPLNLILETLQTIQSPDLKAEAWVSIACHPIGASYQTIALRAIRELPGDGYLQAQALQSFIPHLQYQHRLEAFSVISDISDKYYRVTAWVALARKFPESEFFNVARDNALGLGSLAQEIEQLSTLAIDVPELLPSIVKAIAPINAIEKSEVSQESNYPDTTFEQNVERQNILTALVPHLPMRINQEVKRERVEGHPISNDLWNRAVYLLARSYRDALRGGSLRNESAQDKDSLNLQDEVNALSNLLLMRDLEPPMAVGILGGWGGGKSYIMHLMQTRMTQVRSQPINQAEAWSSDPSHEKLSPYVGHIYQIKFDAWTFAKSDLWASLMQTIFFELNRQITLEQKLLKFFNDNSINPYAEGSLYSNIWKVLYQIRDEERDYFLERVLQKPDLENLDPAQQEKVDELLWKKRDIVKQAATEERQKQKNALDDVNKSLKQKQDQLKTVKAQLEKSQERDVQQLVGQVNQILVVSGVLLRKRIGNEAFEAFEQQIITLLPSDSNPESLRKFGGDIRLLISNILEGTDAEGKPFNFSLKVLKQWGHKNLSFIVLFCGFAAASVLAPFLVAWKLPGAIVPQLVAFVAPLLPAIGIAQKLWRASQRWYEQTKQALLDCETQIKGSHTVIKRETQRFQKHQEERIATLQADIDQLTQKAQELEKLVEVAQEAVPENVYASLHEFVNTRIKEGIYDKNLGLMHQVKEDLTNLSYRLLPPQLGSEEYLHKLDDLKAVFPRGPARVVVYIDDLDRCPPDRVVQVLEAVQLLVKTPLFIAVLAIDERYITRALEKFYEGVLSRRGRPSGTDYLEKIIQLPYRVRPIMANTLESYLRSHVVIQDNATGGAKFSEFSRQEFNKLLDCCQQVDLSPRTIKRLTNVYKLFKIVCRTRGTKPNLQVQQSILALLALSGRYPNLMRGIFDDIQTCFEEQRTPEKAEQRNLDQQEKTLPILHLKSPLRDFFKKYQLPEGDRYLQREFDKLKHDALQTEILPRTLTLDDMTHEVFNLIRSFSFVGEIGEDPEDYRFSGPEVEDQSLEGKSTDDAQET